MDIDGSRRSATPAPVVELGRSTALSRRKRLWLLIKAIPRLELPNRNLPQPSLNASIKRRTTSRRPSRVSDHNSWLFLNRGCCLSFVDNANAMTALVILDVCCTLSGNVGYPPRLHRQYRTFHTDNKSSQRVELPQYLNDRTLPRSGPSQARRSVNERICQPPVRRLAHDITP